MTKYIFYLTFLIFLTGCEDVLDRPDPSAINPEVWDSEQAATLYLNKLYAECLPTFSGNSQYSDESPGGDNYMYGTLTAEDVGNFSLDNYRKIRNINIAIDEAMNGSLPEDAKNRILGQAYFLRAWRYWELVKLYGGVPLALEPQDPYNDDLNIPRSKTSECVEQIVWDLDKAIAGLPASWPTSERGRVTRGAAAALKGRVLLFWASPQYNPENKTSRWQRAYDANKAAKDTLEKDGYGLYPDFENIFLEEGNDEGIFGRLYDYGVDKVHTWENSCRPRAVGLDGGTANNPTIHLVNAFPMKNGLNIDDPASGYDSVFYFRGRDPRFYATIAYNGCLWEFNGFPAGRKQWNYYYFTLSVDQEDTLEQSVETESPTTTGFYCRKAVNSNIPQDQVRQTGTDWIEIRFAEVLLNLAECAAELGYLNEAKTALVAIRRRAGIEAGDGSYGITAESVAEMVEAVMLERQVELAFEDKRYWDLRRRNLFAEKLNGTYRYGIKTFLKPIPDSTLAQTVNWFRTIRDTIDLNNNFDEYFYTELWLKDERSEINYPQPLYNFFAIPPAMLDRSPAIEQTLGWDNGTFDPLEE